MAGDWIKLEAATPDKPEVYRMADLLDIAPEHVVGCLVALWVWADQQTIDGNAPGVTRSLVDRKSGVTGFAGAMESVGWLTQDDHGLHFPNFDRHNGKTAKSRALTAKRVARHKGKSNAEGNAVSVSEPLPREEKRREVKDNGRPEQPADRFDDFWEAYPTKVKKQDARKKWKNRKLDRIADQIIEDVKKRQRSDKLWLDGYVPHPTTYINGSRWEDEIETQHNAGPTSPHMRVLS